MAACREKGAAIVVRWTAVRARVWCAEAARPRRNAAPMHTRPT